MDGTLVIAALTTLLSIALMGPLMGGYLRLIHASEQGRPAQPPTSSRRSQVAQPTPARMIGFAFVMLMVHLGVGYRAGQPVREGQGPAGVVPEGDGRTVAADATGGKPVQLPPPPDGLGGFFGLGGLFALFVGGVFAVGLGQVALRGATSARRCSTAWPARRKQPAAAAGDWRPGLRPDDGAERGAGAAGWWWWRARLLLHPALAGAVLLPLYMRCCWCCTW